MYCLAIYRESKIIIVATMDIPMSFTSIIDILIFYYANHASLYFNRSKRITKCPRCHEIDNDIVSMHIFSEKEKTYANNSLSDEFDDRLLRYNKYNICQR